MSWGHERWWKTLMPWKLRDQGDVLGPESRHTRMDRNLHEPRGFAEKGEVIWRALDPTAAPQGGWARQHITLGVGSRAQARAGAAAKPRGVGPPAGLGLHLSLASPRATSNARVRETVALELSYVNSSLQLLKEELEGLDGNVDADQPPRCVCTRVQGHGLAPDVCVCVCARTQPGPRGACVQGCGAAPAVRVHVCAEQHTPRVCVGGRDPGQGVVGRVWCARTCTIIRGEACPVGQEW